MRDAAQQAVIEARVFQIENRQPSQWLQGPSMLNALHSRSIVIRSEATVRSGSTLDSHAQNGAEDVAYVLIRGTWRSSMESSCRFVRPLRPPKLTAGTEPIHLDRRHVSDETALSALKARAHVCLFKLRSRCDKAVDWLSATVDLSRRPGPATRQP